MVTRLPASAIPLTVGVVSLVLPPFPDLPGSISEGMPSSKFVEKTSIGSSPLSTLTFKLSIAHDSSLKS